METNLFGHVSELLVLFAIAAGVSLAASLVVELSAAALFGLRRQRELAAVACVNLMTNPVVLWAYLTSGNSAVPGGPSERVAWASFILLEVSAIVVEWRLLTWALEKPSRQMLRLSVVANFASLVLGYGLSEGLLLL